MLERNPPLEDIRAVCAFLVYVRALLLMWQPGEHQLMKELMKGGEKRREIQLFCALPLALAEVAPELAFVPGLEEDSDTWARWQGFNQSVFDFLGPGVVESVVARVSRHFQALASAGLSR